MSFTRITTAEVTDHISDRGPGGLETHLMHLEPRLIPISTLPALRSSL